MLRLTVDEVEAALYALHDLISRRRLAGRPIPGEVNALYRRLLGSELGTESQPPAPQLIVEGPINVAEAATILGCSREYVRRIAADIDGQQLGRYWVFPRRSVVEYAAAKGVGGDGYRVSDDGRGAVSA